jgi:MazG family protein
MDPFLHLLSIADRLLGPGGCPWDKEQTLKTLQPYLLEEIHELIEAIDQGDAAAISEELGDAFYGLIFVAKLAEDQRLCTLEQALQSIAEKLIRRHPHIFGDAQVSGSDQVLENWEKIKKEEKGESRRHMLDGIPPTLTSLPRAQKIAKKLKRAKHPDSKQTATRPLTEEELARELFSLVQEAEAAHIDLEGALRRYCAHLEQSYKP